MEAISSHPLPKLSQHKKFKCFHMPKSKPSSSHLPNSLNVLSIRNDTSTSSSTSADDVTAATTSSAAQLLKKQALSRLKINTPLIFDALDEFISKFIDPPLRPSTDPRYVLSGNFAPVDELSPTECEVLDGFLPPCLDGVYIRNGPNPQFLPSGPYHLFDGNGMLHSIKISQGKATFCSRYVKTYRYMLEHEMGSKVIPHVFSGFSSLMASVARGVVSAARMLTGQYTHTNGIGFANTSVAFFGGSLYALGESDLPYAIKVTQEGDIITLGRCDFDGKLVMNMTAHPKSDPDTGETFAFRYGAMRPFLTFFRFDANGKKQHDVPIFSMTSPSFVHDFAITKNYAIFPDIQLGMKLLDVIFGLGPIIGMDWSKVPRLGDIPRYAKDETEKKWFNVLGINVDLPITPAGSLLRNLMRQGKNKRTKTNLRTIKTFHYMIQVATII